MRLGVDWEGCDTPCTRGFVSRAVMRCWRVSYSLAKHFERQRIVITRCGKSGIITLLCIVSVEACSEICNRKGDDDGADEVRMWISYYKMAGC